MLNFGQHIFSSLKLLPIDLRYLLSYKFVDGGRKQTLKKVKLIKKNI